MSRLSVRLKAVVMVGIAALAVTALGLPRAEAANRPFPRYDLTFQRIVGQKDPNWKPGDPGDGCVRSENPTVEHLTTFGFKASINPCDGVRTRVRFYLPDTQEAPTLEFRFGTTFQYVETAERDRSRYILKPVERFLYDGKPVSREQYNPDDPVVRDSDGKPVRMSNGTGFYEPIHYVFEDTFGPNDEHVIEYDSYLPANADWAGITWGTGSTGDTGGGSIGARANGLTVSITGGVDYRYVLDSEYRAAMGIAPDAAVVKNDGSTAGLPPRPKVTRFANTIAGSTYTTVDCLEGQQLAPLIDRLPVSKLADGATSNREVTFRDAPYSYAVSEWPTQFYLRHPETWNMSGLRPMNWNSDRGAFDPYRDSGGGVRELPYKPTLAQLHRQIPGYRLVDNDLPVLRDAAFERMQSNGVPVWKPGLTGVIDYHQSGADLQHFYFTYEPIPGTFELKKVNADRKAIAGARFELYEEVPTAATACGAQPDLSNTETVTVCTGDGKDCAEHTVRKVRLPGSDSADGSFTTDAKGRFAPSGDPALKPGKYLLKETRAPRPYVIDNAWTPFEIPLQTAAEPAPVQVTVVNRDGTVPPGETPPGETPPGETPPKPVPPAPHPPKPGNDIPATGVDPHLVALGGLALLAAGAALLARRRTLVS